MRRSEIHFSIILVLVICLISAAKVSVRKDTGKKENNHLHSVKFVEVIKDESDTPLTIETLANEIKRSGVRFPEVVFAQAMEESGYLTSRLCKEANNLFGMKVPGSRPTTMITSNNGYCEFETWQQSVRDYALFQSAFGRKVSNSKAYIKFLSSVYASNPNYGSKIASLVHKYKYLFDGK